MSETPHLDAARSDRRRRVRTAAMVALRCYPGPVGEVLCAELLSWDTIGRLLHELPPDALILQLVEHLEAKAGVEQPFEAA